MVNDFWLKNKHTISIFQAEARDLAKHIEVQPKKHNAYKKRTCIRKNAAPEYWMYVPTDINPADITTRLLSPNTFVSCELWWKGPDFLQFGNIDMPC